MKTVKIENQEYKVSKKFIREILTLERGVDYYSVFNNDLLAHAIAFGEDTCGLDGNEPLYFKTDYIYDHIEEIVKDWVK
jgi:hypothetical protein